MLEMIAPIDRCDDPREWHYRHVDVDGGSRTVEERVHEDGCDFFWPSGTSGRNPEGLGGVPQHLRCDETGRFYRCACVDRADYGRYDFEKAVCTLNQRRLNTVEASLRSLRAATWSCGSFDTVRGHLDAFTESSHQASSDAQATNCPLEKRMHSLTELQPQFERRFDAFHRYHRDDLARLQTMLGTCEDAGVLVQLDELAHERFLTPSQTAR